MSVGPSLSQYLRNVLEDVREEERYIPIEVWTMSESGVSSDDAFGVPTGITSGAQLFSGAVAWGRTIQKEGSPGGYYEQADVTVIAHMDNKLIVDGENKYLVVEGVSVRASRIIDVSQTQEIVIYCEKYQP